MRKALSLTVGLVVALTACGGGDDGSEASPDAPFFAGLDRAVVEEVLENPRAQANVEILEAQDRPGMWQGMAVNFSFCRDVLEVYEKWRDSGDTPRRLAALDKPDTPESSYADMVKTLEFYEGEVRSGDISSLRSLLLNESGCGVWIPARAGDADGPTIADQVRADG